MTRYIYLLSAEFDDKTLYKIGISHNVERRIKELQTGNPYKIVLKEKFKTPYAFKIEAALHRRYKIDNIKGEWFDFDISTYTEEVKILHEGFRVLDSSDNHYFRKEFDKLKNIKIMAKVLRPHKDYVFDELE